MKKNNIKLSIIIPVYNGEKYIEDCLESIYKNYSLINFTFETIIINDGSKDNSSLIYNKYKKNYNNIIIIENENNGVSYTRNCGIDIAKGEYIIFVDCDDLLIDNWYDVINNILKNNNSNAIFLSKDFVHTKNEQNNKEEILSYVITYNQLGIRISGPYSKLFNTVFLKENNIKFKPGIINGEDMLFCAEAVVKAKSISLIKASIYIVRHNKYSATSKFDERIIESEIKFNQEMKQCLGNMFNSEIERYCFLISIRTLSYRLGRIDSLKKMKSKFLEIYNNQYFKNGLLEYKYDDSIKSLLIYYLFKYKMYYFLYWICKIKNKKNNKDYFETL